MIKMNDYQELDAKPFQQKYLDEDERRTKKAPIPVKLNPKEEEMIEIGMYAFNMHSKSGVLKYLAVLGFKKVLLDTLGVERMHYLTRGDRTRVIRKKPNFNHWSEKGI